MRFRLTVFLIVANIVLFLFIWALERDRTQTHPSQKPIQAFTVLEISGKNLSEPRKLKFENNRWHIVAPIKWKANLFAVNRIKTQLEFLDRQTSFSKREALKVNQTLADYGLDNPAYIISFGDGEKMSSIKIGNTTSVGNRFYLLDENNDNIIVVDKEVVEGLIVDMERLRDQSIFSIPRLEISSFAARIQVSKKVSATESDFKRVGLVKNNGNWSFETPIVASAENAKVDAFLNDICQLTAKNLEIKATEKTGFELGSLPSTITLQGINRREVLLLGALSSDGELVYARLENNPTIFAIDSSILNKLEQMQTSLRDKVMLRTMISRVSEIDISRNEQALKLKKQKNGEWNIVVKDNSGKELVYEADLARVNKLLLSLEVVKAREIVSVPSNKELKKYGINDKALKVTIVNDNQESNTIIIGSLCRKDGVNMRYASVSNSPEFYCIGMNLMENISTDMLFYRNKLICSLEKDALLKSIKIVNESTKNIELEVSVPNNDLSLIYSKMTARNANSLKIIENFIRNSVASSYSTRSFNKEGVRLRGDKIEKWQYSLLVQYEVAGKAMQREWKFSKRISATSQYCIVNGFDVLFFPEADLINALFELTQEKNQPTQLDKPQPIAPNK
ncbi:MAG: DUF4340 domain-containing protein [Opitutales bacterium]|nr:DUF4340 domain-containing protein [Opitutales bacterium]